MRVVRRLLLPVVMFAASPVASAQSGAGELFPGASVRVRTDPPGTSWVSGKLTSASRDSLVLLTDDGERAFARRDVRELEVKRRRARSSTSLRRALWVGLFSTAVLVPAYLGPDQFPCGADQCRIEGGDFAQIATPAFAASVLGQAIGAIWPGRAWLAMSPTPQAGANISLPPRGSRVRITAAGFTAPDLEGVVTTSTADSLALIVQSSVIAVPSTAVSQIEYATGLDRLGGVWRGVKQTLPTVGVYLSAALLEHTEKEYRNGVPVAPDEELVQRLLGTAAFAVGVGAGLGALIAPHQWDSRGASTSLLVAPDSKHQTLRVGLAMKF